MAVEEAEAIAEKTKSEYKRALKLSKRAQKRGARAQERAIATEARTATREGRAQARKIKEEARSTKYGLELRAVELKRGLEGRKREYAELHKEAAELRTSRLRLRTEGAALRENAGRLRELASLKRSIATRQSPGTCAPSRSGRKGRRSSGTSRAPAPPAPQRSPRSGGTSNVHGGPIHIHVNGGDVHVHNVGGPSVSVSPSVSANRGARGISGLSRRGRSPSAVPRADRTTARVHAQNVFEWAEAAPEIPEEIEVEEILEVEECEIIEEEPQGSCSKSEGVTLLNVTPGALLNAPILSLEADFRAFGNLYEGANGLTASLLNPFVAQTAFTPQPMVYASSDGTLDELLQLVREVRSDVRALRDQVQGLRLEVDRAPLKTRGSR